MISLSKYIRAKILKENKQQLNEAFKYFNALSFEVKDILLKYLKDYIGENSKIAIVPYEPTAIWDKLSNEIVAVNIRYGQDDLLLLYYKWSTLNIYAFNDYDELERKGSAIGIRMGKYFYGKPKTESGFIKLFNQIALNLSKVMEKPKKEILAKMNCQVIYADEEKEKKKAQHQQYRYNKNYIEKDGKEVLSNYGMKNVAIKDRLKNFIENKMKNITNINDIPRELDKMRKGFQFKLFGNIYLFQDISTTENYYKTPSISDMMQGNKAYIAFRRINYINENYVLPRYLTIELEMKNYQLIVGDKIFMGDDYNNLQPIEQVLSQYN